MLFDDCLKIIRTNLTQPLPGAEAHKLMLPANRMLRINLNLKFISKKSGVAIIVYPENGQTYSVLIERASYKGVHSGQIGLPGGKKEDDDNTLIDTALREAEEEIGVSRKQLEVIGSLSDLYIPPSNFLVHPVVAVLHSPPVFVPDPAEVNKVITYNLDELLVQGHPPQKLFKGFYYSIEAPYFDIRGFTVWGATAMILNEFRWLLTREKQY